MKNKKILLMCICFALLFTACKTTSKVYWEEVEVAYEQQDIGLKALMSYPMRFGGVDSVTTKINNKIEAFLKSDIIDSCETCSLDSALVVLSKIKESDSILYRIPYEFYSEGSVNRWSDFASVKITKSSYTGGANFNINTVFMNFDTKTGDIVSLKDIFSDLEPLTQNVRRNFFVTRGITEHNFKDSITLLPANMQIPLAEQIGFDTTGVLVFYNLYEVAPRSFGTTEVVVPFDSIKGINDKYKELFYKK